MTAKNPLVQYAGINKKLQSGDSLNLVGTSNGVITNGLIAKWNLANDTLDSSGNGNHAVAGPAFGLTPYHASMGLGVVAYGNGIYVAVNSNTATTMYSYDGLSWIPGNSSSTGLGTGVAYGNGIFVAIGNTTQCAVSTDGINWTAKSITTGTWWTLAFGNGLFVAGGGTTSPYIVTSPDGVTWTTRTIATGVQWSAIWWSGSQFFASSSTGTEGATSPDGITWTQRLLKQGYWTGFASNGSNLNIMCANGSTYLWQTSPDCVTWTNQTNPITGATWGGIAYGNGIFVAIGVGGVSGYITSTDGINWSSTLQQFPNGFYGNTIRFLGGKFILTGNGNVGVQTSTDGLNWTAGIGIYTDIQGSCYNGSSLFVTVGGSTNSGFLGYSGSSANGLTRRVMPAGLWKSVTYGSSLYVAVGSTGGANQCATTPDGTTWTAQAGIPAGNWQSITYGNSKYVAVANSGANLCATSALGVTWTTQTIPANAWVSVIYANSLFVAIASDGACATSPDGVTWTSRSIPSGTWSGITYSNTLTTNLFVVVGQSSGANQCATSPDAINWTTQTIPSGNWRTVTFGYNLFIAAADSGTIAAISLDGINWTTTTCPAGAYVTSCFGANNYFFGAPSSTPVTSMTSASGGVALAYSSAAGRNTATFNGYGYLTFPDTTMPSGNAPFTMGCWVYQSATGTTHVMSYGSSTVPNYRSVELGSGWAYLVYAGTGYGTASTYYLSNSAFHHVVVTYDGSNIRVYTDGVFSAYGTRSASVMATTVGLGGTLGCLVGVANKFTGQMYDCRIYGRVLSYPEIMTWYAGGG